MLCFYPRIACSFDHGLSLFSQTERPVCHDDVVSNCRYEFQMQFGSIGWSVGATLGYAQALKGKKRVIASIGDGSFQVTAQVRLAFFFCLSTSLPFIIFHTLSCNFMFPFFFLLSSCMRHPCHLRPPLQLSIISVTGL